MQILSGIQTYDLTRIPQRIRVPETFNSDSKVSDMNKLLAVFLLLFSASVMADKPDCNNSSVANCGNSPPGLDKASAIPIPGTLALVGLGLAGLAIARHRKGSGKS